MHNQHPTSTGTPATDAFSARLAVQGKVAGSIQTQALTAIVCLYREVLGRDVAAGGEDG
ncbi:MAG TPA: phage integrase N-terminal SAM-like domain-containing protein [Candidatus Tectomicrobia bacterium]|nr:phage integrase N-terminal SAM-like domain-containing protein [Candidatus Tectomicrobia bacterium]